MRNFLFIALVLCISACSFTQKITDGKTAYERKQFALAINMLPVEYQKEKSQLNKGKIAFMLGESYQRINNNEESIDWFKTAYDKSYGVDALKEYAKALKKAERYKEAKAAYKELGIELGSPYEYRKDISSCDIAQGWKENEKRNPYRIKNESFNSDKSDYAAVVTNDGSIVFTSDRGSFEEKEEYKWTGNKYSDLYKTDINGEEITSFSDNLNSDENNEGTACFNSDMTELIYTKCFGEEKVDHYCKLMSSVLTDSIWSEPKTLEFTKTGINYGHPCFHPSGNIIFFSCNDPDGWGGYDIYASERNAEGWGEPRVLGRTINTEKNEKFPFLDNDTLYFASDGHTGMGGLDIYKTFMQKGNKWSPAKNMLPPINSGEDDFGLVVDKVNEKSKDVLVHGYFSSSRNNGIGNDDIYKFEKIVPPPPPPAPEKDSTEIIVEKPIEYKILLEIFVVENIFENNNPNGKVLGRRPLSTSKLDMKTGQDKTASLKIDKTQSYTIELKEESDYYFFASNENYLNKNSNFSTKGIGKDPANPIQKFELEIILDKIYKDKEIVLENIYYDYDKWDIRTDAEPSLLKLNNILVQNPDVKIQLSSHTDCRGRGDYNQTLSQKRAQSVMAFLIEKGIDSERLTARGYGKSALAIDCSCNDCTEEEHQANRRTTFKIVD